MRRFAFILFVGLTTLSVSAEKNATRFAPGKRVLRRNEERPLPENTPEFSGVARLRGELQFSLRDPATGRAAWVKLRDNTAPYRVESYDERTGTLVVRLARGPVAVSLRGEAPASASPPVETHVRADGKVWTDPPDGKGRHPDDPGNAD